MHFVNVLLWFNSKVLLELRQYQGYNYGIIDICVVDLYIQDHKSKLDGMNSKFDIIGSL